ncbi:hypothetical protein ASE12_14110 [Aeromicrobium sp. Root236]|uniref:CocE/NonD family hydrolase n=1 Tax=Aeromicrobium sp. Root236 TaxID=1736498 RepID=UPI0006FEB972|nr:CocE/NonD family hydrolase [Aeromicrobium sp. Root236]KRC65792.1 hypothetical protein ASE12_14110 [Aeromicrobium sp. Root236]
MPGPVEAPPAPLSPDATQHLVPMRDGIRLATDVYRPVGVLAPLPVVLVRLPYDKNSPYVFMAEVAARLNARGYVAVVQDVRGKFRSEGVAVGPVSEVNDGYDTIDWIVGQEWSDGRVGMFGDSYYGFTQWAALSSGHPALRAIVPRVTTTTIPSMWSGGEGPVEDVDWLCGAQYTAQVWSGNLIREHPINWDAAPLTEAFEQFFGDVDSTSPWFDVSVPRQVPLSIYTNGHPFAQKPIPVLHCVGWYDNLLIPSMRDYMELVSRPNWAPLQYLHADSIDHENYHLHLAPIGVEDDHSASPASLDRLMSTYLLPALDFFDVFLAGSRPVESLPKVQWHLGHDDYRTSASWPPADAHVRDMFLNPASDGSVDHVLTWERPSGKAEVEWLYDPEHLAASPVENSFAFIFEYPDEQSARNDETTVVFDQAPVETPLDLAGPIDLHVCVDSSAPTTDVFARLLDVAPSGEAHLIARGQGILLNPSGTEAVRIEMGHTGYRVREGHSLRLVIRSSDYPEYAPNSGDGSNRWTAAERHRSTQRLVTDGTAPARLALTCL